MNDNKIDKPFKNQNKSPLREKSKNEAKKAKNSQITLKIGSKPKNVQFANKINT